MDTHRPRFVVVVALALALAHCAGGGRLIRQAAELNSRGARQLQRGDLAGAEASFQVALEYNDRYAEPHNNLGLIALGRGRLHEARRHFRAALERNRDFAEAWSNLGVALLHTEDATDLEATPAAAAEAFREALSINPGLFEARANLTRILLASGEHAEALVQARRLTQVDDRSALAHALRAEAALATNALTEADAEAHTAHALDGDSPEVLLVGARVDIARGELDRAFATLTALAGDSRTALEAHALLALLHAATGDAVNARRELDAMGPQGRTHPVALRVLAALARQ